MNTFKTPKGTTLPLLDLKGKAYLQVAHRIQWFREEHPTWAIRTTLLSFDDKHTLAQAQIVDEMGVALASAHKRETLEGFYDHTEKAETGAIGRALALCGYGTQFTDDLEEGERLADAPISRVPTAAVRTSPQAPSAVVGTTSNKWDADAAKNFKVDPTKLASPKQVGRLLTLCEVHQWDKQKASDLSYNKYGKARFSDLSQVEYNWICDKIQKSNYLDTMRELNDSTKAMLASNPPSAQFDENNPPPITDEDVPFL